MGTEEGRFAQPSRFAVATSEARNLRDLRHRRWMAEHRVTDAVFDGKDPFPALIDAASHVEQFARHPRSFLRSLMR